MNRVQIGKIGLECDIQINAPRTALGHPEFSLADSQVEIFSELMVNLTQRNG